jgi:5'-3' exonuclease
MKCDLIIDGNYILSKNTFTLHKNNLLFGSLYDSLDKTISNYKKWYPFDNIYLVSDSKEKSWRKEIYKNYKETRKKDSDIDWKFVYETYAEFKNSLKGRVRVLEYPHIEGDDWISYLTQESNKNGVSTIIVSNDYDIKQKLKYSIDPLYINIMTNQIYNQEKLFIPSNYQIFLNKVSRLPSNDIFNLNYNTEFLNLINGFLNKYNVNEINPTEELIVKIISGDKSDNIISSWYKEDKNGIKRGIGEKGAKTIYDIYLEEYGDLDFKDNDLYENIADIICERKKISKSEMSKIIDNLKFNERLINLDMDNIPDDIKTKMENILYYL